MTEKYIVTATPPTPNGDFHVGHFSGPYLGGDIFSRFQKMRGNEVTFVSSADRNQSYVMTTAERLAVDPDQLAMASLEEMTGTLAKGDIAFDSFNAVDHRHQELVRDFFRQIEANGFVTIKTVPVPYSTREKRYLFESFLAGHCPTCWAPTAGAICETCGHPNNFATLELPRSESNDAALEYHNLDIAFLELEAFRDRILTYYSDKRGKWRPHAIELVDELLERQLPDYPLSYPSDWGIPSPFSGTDGQVLNVWAEMLPGLINSTRLVTEDELWSKESGAKLVQFLGYDNSFFFALVHLALAMAHDDCVLPDTIITNEFFELDNYKFSTSKGHLIWARDLLDEVDVSIARFYLALANPETQKMNFTRAAMDELTEARLLRPFRETMQRVGSEIVSAPDIGADIVIDVNEAFEINTMLDRFARFYDARHFSPQRVAEHLSQLLVRMDAGIDHAAASGEPTELRRAILISWFVLPVVAAPLMPQFSTDLCKALGRTAHLEWRPVQIGEVATISIGSFAKAANVLEPTSTNVPLRSKAS